MAKNPNKRIPGEAGFVQPNEGDGVGTVWSSSNLDLVMRKGNLMVSPRILLNENSSVLTGMNGTPCAIKYFPTSRAFIWAVAGSKVFSSAGGPNSDFLEEIPGVSPPTNCNSNQSDLEVFNGYLYLTAASTTLYKVSSGGVWSALSGRLNNSSGLHDLEFYRGTTRLYFVDDNNASIGSINTADTAATLGAQYTLQSLVDGTAQQISWIKSTSNRIYIGTIAFGGGRGYVYEWDGSQTTPNAAYKLDAIGTLACVIKNDTPYILDTDGKILALNGGTFTGINGKNYIAKFPTENILFGSSFGAVVQRPVHYNGMEIIDGRINILLNSAPYTTGWGASVSVENISSGVWEYTSDNGLYHKASPGLSKAAGTITDYGQKKLVEVGALSSLKIPNINFSPATLNGSYMCGVKYYTDATSSLYGLFYDDFNDTLQKAGYFVTTKLYSSEITDSFSKLIARFNKFAESGDKMIVKYRETSPDPIEVTITWASTTTFTTPTDVTAYVDKEVEVLQGLGSSKCAKIVSAVISGANFLVTVDQTFTGATGTSIARFQNWTHSIEYSGTKDRNEFSVIDTSTWIEMKVFIITRGKWDLNDITLITQPHQAAQ